jgi:hypothetical protein
MPEQQQVCSVSHLLHHGWVLQAKWDPLAAQSQAGPPPAAQLLRASPLG